MEDLVNISNEGATSDFHNRKQDFEPMHYPDTPSTCRYQGRIQSSVLHCPQNEDFYILSLGSSIW